MDLREIFYVLFPTQFVKLQKEKRVLHIRAEKHFNKKLHRMAWTGWRKYMEQVKKIKDSAETKYKAKCAQTLRSDVIFVMKCGVLI